MRKPFYSNWGKHFGSTMLLASGLLLAGKAEAQVDTYVFTSSTGTYTPLANGTVVTDIMDDDAESAVLPLGFSFTFDGTAYTQFVVSSNGWLSFNTAATDSRFNDLDNGPADERPLIAPFWDDLDGGGSASSASYATTGTAPNRVFTFEWLNWERFFQPGEFSMQVQLFEGTNQVRLVYQRGATALTTANASIGLSGINTSSCSSFLSLSDASATPTASGSTENDNIAESPATGQIYSFVPATASSCPTPRCLSATTTATGAVVSFSVGNTNSGPFTVIYGPSGFDPATSGTTVTGTGTSIPVTGLTANTPYQFYVTQNCGGALGSSTRSLVGDFTTNPNPPANDDCAAATVLPVTVGCSSPLTGTVYGASQSQAPSSNCGFATTAEDVWYSFTATSISHSINLSAQFDAVFELFSGSCTNTTAIYCNTLTGGNSTTRTVGSLTIGQRYFLRVYPSNSTPGQGSADFTLCLTQGPATPTNDDCIGAINVPIQYGTQCVSQTSADNTAATDSPNVPAPGCASYVGQDLWFKVTVPASGELTVKTVVPTAGSSVEDTGMAIYSGACGTLALVGCNDDGAGALKSQLDFSGTTARTPGEVLYIRVWEFGGDVSGLIAVCATAPSNCPLPAGPAAGTLTNTTADLSFTAGGTVNPGDTFEIEYGPSGYTLGTGTAVNGLTSPSYQLTSLQPDTEYCFYVRQNCGPTNGSSPWVGPTCFRTPLTVPNNDEPCGAFSLATSSGTVSGTTIGATTSLQNGISLPACSPAASPKDVWFVFTLDPTTTTTTLNLAGTAAGMVRLFTSPDCAGGPFVQVGCQAAATNNAGFPNPVVFAGLTGGQRYWVAVSGFGSSDAPGAFTVSATNTVLGTRAASAAAGELAVYPNPSNTGELTLRVAGAQGAGEAALVNALGQVVRRVPVAAGSSEQRVSTRGLAAGVYTLRLTVGQRASATKVVLQ